MTTLRDAQLWFAGAVVDGARLDEAERRLTPGPKLGARERLEVYRRGYVARLLECLADDYPVLKRALGDERFEALGRAYVDRFPSASPNLNVYGRRMPSLCEGFLADLAALEWAIVEVVHAPSVAAMRADALGAILPDAWAGARLVASPALRLLRAGWPVNAYYQAVRDGADPAVPAEDPSATAVYRAGTTVWRLGLAPPMADLLAALVAGRPLGDALSSVAAAPEQVSGWFREWVSGGLFVRVEVPRC